MGRERGLRVFLCITMYNEKFLPRICFFFFCPIDLIYVAAQQGFPKKNKSTHKLLSVSRELHRTSIFTVCTIKILNVCSQASTSKKKLWLSTIKNSKKKNYTQTPKRVKRVVLGKDLFPRIFEGAHVYYSTFPRVVRELQGK